MSNGFDIQPESFEGAKIVFEAFHSLGEVLFHLSSAVMTLGASVELFFAGGSALKPSSRLEIIFLPFASPL